MHLVVGATGHLGTEICRRLKAKGHAARGLVRDTSDPSRIAILRDLGVETIAGDLRDPASLERACSGVATVISTANTMRSRAEGDSLAATDREGHGNLIVAAERSGVSHFVFVSFSGNFGGEDGLSAAKRGTEEALRRSGMSWTILRPSLFMEVWLGPHTGFDYPSGKVTIYGSGEQKISWIALGDVAEFAVLAAERPEAKNAVIELGGPEAISPLDAVRVFEEISGRHFELQHVPAEALEAKSKSAADPYEKTFATLMYASTKGDAIPMKKTLETFPVEMTSVGDYARRAMGKESPATDDATT